MPISIINPKNSKLLAKQVDCFVDSDGYEFPIVNGVPRICEPQNYTASFGLQWNKFPLTQLDRDGEGMDLSRRRFFAETRWNPECLSGKNILEVGSGAGRFSKVVLEHTNAILYSVDYSDAVTANFKSNGHIAPERFHLFQASIYEMPFPDNSFDKVFCFGVLQHTPDFEESVKALIAKAKPGAEVVVDFYPIKGWWTKISAKYILRPFTKRIPHDKLFGFIESNVDWLIRLHFFMHEIGVGVLTRFLPLCNVKESFPHVTNKRELRELTILDTFDQYSPEHDHPQRIADVKSMFERHGADVTFFGFEEIAHGMSAAVVRGIKR